MHSRLCQPSCGGVEDLPCGSFCPLDLSRGSVVGLAAKVGGTGGGHDWSTLTLRSS